MVETSRRGLVLGSPWVLGMVDLELRGGELVPTGTTFFPAHDAIVPTLRRGLLYFEDIAVPSNNRWPDRDETVSLLAEQGVVTQPVWHLPDDALDGTHPTSLIWRTHLGMFQKLEAESPGKWTFAQLGEETAWPSTRLFLPSASCRAVEIGQIASYRGAEFNLIEGLPVPHATVPLSDILEFKERRQAELLQMRAFMDELYQGIVTSADIPRSKQIQTERLNKAITELSAVMDASPVRRVMDSLQVSLIYDMGKDVLQGAKYAEQFGADTTIGMVAGAGRALLRLKEKLVPSPVKRAGPLVYMYRAHQEGIIQSPVGKPTP